MNAIEIRGLTRRFSDRVAVDHLDLTIAEGEVFALLGQNGAGSKEKGEAQLLLFV